jgi:hypothetical protein
LEEEHRKGNILILGLEEGTDERYLDKQGIVTKFLKYTMKLGLLDGNINYMARLERKKRAIQILVKFTSFSMELEVLKKIRNLAGSSIRKIRRSLIPYLNDAKKFGLREFFKKGQALALYYHLYLCSVT